MARDFVVDAHALIWFLEGNPRLGSAAKLAMEDPSSTLHLPIIALAEACWVVEKKRCAIPSVHDLLRDVDSDRRYVLVPMDRTTLDISLTLASIEEMHDRLIVAAALNLRAQGISASLLTRDENITKSGAVPVVWQPLPRQEEIMSTPTETYSPGLDGVIAGETAISTTAGGLRYRGYPVVELAEKCTFDEVAYLLLHGELPTRSHLANFNGRLIAAQKLPSALSEWLKQLARDKLTPPSPAFNAVPMDVLRTGVSILAHYDPDTGNNSTEANLRKAERLLAQIPLIMGEYRHAQRENIAQQTLAPSREVIESGFTGYIYHRFRGVPVLRPDDLKAFDVSLILYAEHEFNASTFTARVVCSTESDLHSSIVAAIGALKGPLHGGANEKVMDLLRATGGPDKAEQWIRGALARKDKIMGFGHRVYKTGDVRAKVLKEYARQAAERVGDTQWETAAEIIEKVLEKEKNLFPNLDWPAGRLYDALGLDREWYTPIFVASRVAGWSAHVIEQLEHNRIIRPRSRYTGPEEKHVTPIAERR